MAWSGSSAATSTRKSHSPFAARRRRSVGPARAGRPRSCAAPAAAPLGVSSRRNGACRGSSTMLSSTPGPSPTGRSSIRVPPPSWPGRGHARVAPRVRPDRHRPGVRRHGPEPDATRCVLGRLVPGNGVSRAQPGEDVVREPALEPREVCEVRRGLHGPNGRTCSRSWQRAFSLDHRGDHRVVAVADAAARRRAPGPAGSRRSASTSCTSPRRSTTRSPSPPWRSRDTSGWWCAPAWWSRSRAARCSPRTPRGTSSRSPPVGSSSASPRRSAATSSAGSRRSGPSRCRACGDYIASLRAIFTAFQTGGDARLPGPALPLRPAAALLQPRTARARRAADLDGRGQPAA